MTSSLAAISKVAQSSMLFAGGPDRIVVSGAEMSRPTANACSTGGCSTLSERSIARTRNTWLPAFTSEYSIGDEHCSNGWESSWHSKRLTCSLAVKLAKTSKTPSTAITLTLLIVVVGGVVSRTTVHRHSAGDVSLTRATSTARTRRMCAPGARPEKVPLLGQLENDAASSAHSKVASGSSLSNTKVAMDCPVSGSTAELGSDGPKTMLVSGGRSSTTVQFHVVTGASPPASSDTYTRTWNVCGPSGTPL